MASESWRHAWVCSSPSQAAPSVRELLRLGKDEACRQRKGR